MSQQQLKEALVLLNQLLCQEYRLMRFLVSKHPTTIEEVHRQCSIIQARIQALSDWMADQQME